MIKDTNFAGSFYPKDKDELLKYFEIFDKNYTKNFIESITPKIIIVPHAGYIYSGFTASIAYNLAKRSLFESAIIIAPSHHVRFDGVSISDYSAFVTPFGKIATDNKLSKKLQKSCKTSSINTIHSEHSSEVQLPFIKHYLNNTKVVEVIYSETEPATIAKIIEMAIDASNNLVVISSDLSHFYDQKTANLLDSFCVQAVEQLNYELLINRCEACGVIGVAAAILYAQQHNLQSKILDYRTSADTTGDLTRVVGYMSACFY